ncbi:MAG: hypothetical protein JWN15_2912 [Firmicutes bacterium]|nr:hypothetical protein [Bacillota bacterium]
MKLVTFEVSTAVGPVKRIGALQGERIIDLNAAFGAYLAEVRESRRWREVAEALLPPEMLRFIETGPLAMESAHTAIEYATRKGSEPGPDGTTLIHAANSVRLRAPVERPLSMRDSFVFETHARHSWERRGLSIPPLWYEIPQNYRTTHTSIAGPDDPIIWPSYSEKLDYELEMAVCIGKYGIDIPPEKADEYIFGYTIYNDVSARDTQFYERPVNGAPVKGKNFVNSNILGPCLVTADELDASNLKMEARVNGEVWSQGNTSDMYHKFPAIISYLSQGDAVHPGEFIGSGTPGFGCGLELDRWIQPGDVVELEIEGMGVLRNKVERPTKVS